MAIWFLPILVIVAGTGVVLSYGSVNRLMFRLAGQPLGPNGRTAPGGPLRGPRTETKVSGPLDLDRFAQELMALHQQWRGIDFRFPKNGDPRSAVGIVADVQVAHPWPPFATTTARWDARAGVITERIGYASMGPGLRARKWVRLLHTGEAFLLPGQIVAAAGCLAGCFLVWTSYSMAWRRLFGRR